MELTTKSLYGWGRTAPSTAQVLSTPDVDVLIEAVLGTVGEGEEILDPQLIPLRRGDDGRFAARFALAVPGRVGYTVRVTPQHPVLSSRAELGLVTTA